MEKHTDLMRQSIKGIVGPKEEKIIKKFDINEYISKMNEESLKNAQEELQKTEIKKFSKEEILEKFKISEEKATIIPRKIPKKLNAEQILHNMIDNNKQIEENKNKIDEDSFENLTIRNRSRTVFENLSNIKKIEEENKRLEEEKKLIEENRKKKLEERERREKERKRLEEERKRKEEEERIKIEEERKKLEEELRLKREEEEKERIKLAEELRGQLEEEERKRREEERIKREEERKKLEEKLKKMEEEEKRRKEEEERKRKEEYEKYKIEVLNKLNKKEEDLEQNELNRLIECLKYDKQIEEYNKINYKDYSYDCEGKNIKYTFEEVNQISTEPIINLEVTKTGKLVVLTHKNISKITIYEKDTYNEEKCIILESKVNSMKINSNHIYCALNENTDNILIISLETYDIEEYLNGHEYYVNDLTFTKYGYMISADIKGNIIVWKNNQIYKKGNDFHNYINTITETDQERQKISILSFSCEKVKFYDLRYSNLECIATIGNIKGSGLKNNMLQLSKNILAIAGTYIYIIDLNSLIVTNQINCALANDCISSFHFNKKGYFFISQALTSLFNNEMEKGILSYYQYTFNDEIIPEKNTLIKLASKPGCHKLFITSIKQIDSKTIVTGGFDGKIKFWNLNGI